MQLGFVIDHSRCIGCHACTVACKSENDVPLGSFRTWVKYTEEGRFPTVRRSFAVLRCNQCSEAPCVTICPVKALEKRPDGIVDIDPARCIGCKGCMQACPYDALYINDQSGTAEKCHFCAHRVERGLAPACAVVCPTEAIIPGDFDDPQSVVSKMKATGELTARKRQAGTGPNVLYRDTHPAGIDPLQTNAAGGYIWADQLQGPKLDAQTFEALDNKAKSRTVYDVEHPPAWGSRVSAYLFTKSIAAGALLAGAALLPPFSLGGQIGARAGGLIAGLALVFLALTSLLLVLDLKRPDRFLYILRYANWNSWIARGTFVLGAYGLIAGLLLLVHVAGIHQGPAVAVLTLLGIPTAALTASYTAWLFRQARGRVLWMRRGLALGLLVHAVVAGAALLMLVLQAAGAPTPALDVLRLTLVGGLALSFLLERVEGACAPPGREQEYERASRLISRGPYALRRRLAMIGGIGIPALLLTAGGPVAWAVAALLALAGLYVEQDIFVNAGQSQSIS